MDFKRVNNILSAADLVGCGAKQRHFVQYAIRLLARDYIASMVEAGNECRDAGEILTELVVEEINLKIASE